MNGTGERSAEQRARDGRLAWIIVGCCAALTVALVVGLVYGLSGSFVRMATQDARPVVTVPTAPAPPPLPVPTADERPAELAAEPLAGGQVQKRSGPVRDAPSPPPRSRGDDMGEVRKQGAVADNEAGKSSGDDDDAPISRGRDAPRAPAEPDSPADRARRI